VRRVRALAGSAEQDVGNATNDDCRWRAREECKHAERARFARNGRVLLCGRTCSHMQHEAATYRS
jgi:hypothetical protein